MTPALAHSRHVEPTAGWPALLDALERLGSVVVAFSGGVDSTLLAKAAKDVLGDKALAVTAVSPSLAASERDAARDLAAFVGIAHLEIATHEANDPRYVANGADRCYFCKGHLFTELEIVRRERRFGSVVYGAITDDLGDDRPGMVAAREAGAIAPLLDAGISKAEAREASRRLRLPTADKPALACLASRLPRGVPVTVQRLAQVERAEEALRDLGFRQLRVRHHGDMARVEVEPADIARALEMSELVAKRLAVAGYSSVEIDPAGYGGRRSAPPDSPSPE